MSILKEYADMSQNLNYPNFPPQNRPALEPDELDDATLDEVVGGLDSYSQMSNNLQYLQWQNQMQTENISYTTVSDIIKIKHDTAKNSIGNFR